MQSGLSLPFARLFLTRKSELHTHFAHTSSFLTVSRMIRDQASKIIDLYLQRIKKFGSTLPDTVSQPAGPSEDSTKDAARIGTSNDKSWAGWAISSFTNKIATADGEIEPTANGGQSAEPAVARPSSAPRVPKSPQPTSRVDALKETSRPTNLNRSVSEQPTPVSKVEEAKAEDEAEDAFEAWDAMEDDEDESHASKNDDFDPFSASAAPSSKLSPSLSTTSKASSKPYDDGGEPDFAGWLAAQSKAKSKKPLPKGLNKPASASSSVTSSRTATSTTAAAKPKPAAAPAKKIDTTPKDNAADDDDDGWGEWD